MNSTVARQTTTPPEILRAVSRPKVHYPQITDSLNAVF